MKYFGRCRKLVRGPFTAHGCRAGLAAHDVTSARCHHSTRFGPLAACVLHVTQRSHGRHWMWWWQVMSIRLFFTDIVVVIVWPTRHKSTNRTALQARWSWKHLYAARHELNMSRETFTFKQLLLTKKKNKSRLAPKKTKKKRAPSPVSLKTFCFGQNPIN